MRSTYAFCVFAKYLVGNGFIFTDKQKYAPIVNLYTRIDNIFADYTHRCLMCAQIENLFTHLQYLCEIFETNLRPPPITFSTRESAG